MRLLADENLDFAVVRALRAAGHDVRALAEETSRTIDTEVIALAARTRARTSRSRSSIWSQRAATPAAVSRMTNSLRAL